MYGVVEYLGCDKVWRSANIARLCLLPIHGEAEVPELGGAIVVEQNVAQFEIAMDNVLAVNVLQRQGHLTDYR